MRYFFLILCQKSPDSSQSTRRIIIYLCSLYSSYLKCLASRTFALHIIIRLRLFRQSCIFDLLCNYYFHVHIHNIRGLHSSYPDVMLCLLHVLLSTLSSYSCICHSKHFHAFYQRISPQIHHHLSFFYLITENLRSFSWCFGFLVSLSERFTEDLLVRNRFSNWEKCISFIMNHELF